MRIEITWSGPGEETLAFAAGELKTYLTRMLPADGADLAVALCAKNDPDGRETFAVSMTERGGSITGSCPRAVLLGAYDYLRRLGCRFLGPGEQWEVVPAVGREKLAADYEKRASFPHRGVCIEGADSRENVLDFIDWLPKAGYNSFFLQFKTPYAFLKRWYHHENNSLREPEPYGEADGSRDMALFQRELKRRDLLLHKVGHGWTGEVLGYEALSWDADPAPLAEDRRELAAEVDGVRDCGRAYLPTPTCAFPIPERRTPWPPWWRTTPGRTPTRTTSMYGWRTPSTMCVRVKTVRRRPCPTSTPPSSAGSTAA